MQKITLTPEFVSEYADKKQALISICNNAISFTNSAEKLLAVTPGISFSIEIDEEGKIYILDAVNGFKVANRQGRIYKAAAKGLRQFFQQYFKDKDSKNFKFEVGEFLEGRRMLTKVIDSKKKINNGK